jgi:CheY-like chemotaxis protein
LAKILVVDDDPGVQTTIRLLLRRAGHDVVVSGHGPNLVVSGRPIGTGMGAEPAIEGKSGAILRLPEPFWAPDLLVTTSGGLEAANKSASPRDRTADAAVRA